MPINFDNIQITGGLNIEGLVVPPIVGDPYWANVSLLMNNTTTNNQTNNTFLDSSTNNFTVTRVGTPTQGSFTPYTVAPNTPYSTTTNGGSGYFDGSGDLLLVSSGANLAIGTSPFTLEGWCYFTNVNTASGGFGSCASFTDVTDARGVSLFLTGSGGWRFRVGRSVVGQFEDFLGTTTLVANRWYHFKIVRTSTGTNDTRVFLDGVQEAIGTSTININMQQFCVGRYLPNDSATTGLLQGYVSDVRLTNNAQPSTVPTSPLTAVSGTQVLFNFTNAGIFDSAVKTNLVTVADAKVSTTQSKFAPTSVFLDGTGDYLLSTESSLAFALGSTFTIEGWVYPTSFASTPVITDVRNTNEAGYFAINTSGNLIARVGASTLTSTTALSLNTWNYVALVSTTSGSAFYINGTQRGTTATAAGFPATARRLYIGSQFDGTQLFVGYMQDLRITKGVARYTSNFTAPTQPFPTN